MTERVQVDPKDIKVGDLIEVETPYGPDGAVIIRRDEVIRLAPGSVETREFSFALAMTPERTFYRLPKPAPVEPKGLGAVVEDRDGDLWVHTEGGWILGEDDPASWSYTLSHYTPLTVKSDGYTQS